MIGIVFSLALGGLIKSTIKSKSETKEHAFLLFFTIFVAEVALLSLIQAFGQIIWNEFWQIVAAAFVEFLLAGILMYDVTIRKSETIRRNNLDTVKGEDKELS